MYKTDYKCDRQSWSYTVLAIRKVLIQQRLLSLHRVLILCRSLMLDKVLPSLTCALPHHQLQSLTMITNALTVAVEAPLTVDIRWTLSITVNAVVKVFHSNWGVREAWTVDGSVGGMENGGYGWGALVSLAERIHWRGGKIISIMGHSILCHTHPKTREIWEKVLAKGEEIWPKNIWPENTKSTQPYLCLEGGG